VGLHLAAFTCGAVVMAAELGASRLVAPFFGTSTPVWALLIGAVLLGLAVGQALGGRMSARSDTRELLVPLLLAAAFLIFLLPFVAPWLMAGSLDLFHRGSVALLTAMALGVTTLLALPLVVLGATSPLLLERLTASSTEPVGAVAGRLYALSTLGSLAGTYGAGLVFIPSLGTSRSLWLFAALLAMVAGALGLDRRLGRLGAVAGVFGLLFVGMRPPAVKVRPNAIFETESADNYIQVTDDGARRNLYLNEGYAVQSVYYRDGRLPLGDVWGYYALAPAWTSSGKPKRALLLGLGGGTSARTLRALFPELEITGVERDAAVVEVATRFFALPGDIKVVIDDGRAFVHRDRSRYDLVIVDAFRFPYVPFQLCTVEFFRTLSARIEPGGVVLLNIGRDGAERSVVESVARSALEVFAHLRSVDVHESTTLLVATHHSVEKDAGILALGLAAPHAARLWALPQAKPFHVDRTLVPLSDDRAPVEMLTDRILFARLTRPEPSADP